LCAHGNALDHVRQLAGALKLDMAEYWQPTAARYFGRVSKQEALDAVAEGVARQAADNLAKLKKDALAKEAEKQLAGTGWLRSCTRPDNGGLASGRPPEPASRPEAETARARLVGASL
jgi:hypothetical protein